MTFNDKNLFNFNWGNCWSCNLLNSYSSDIAFSKMKRSFICFTNLALQFNQIMLWGTPMQNNVGYMITQCLGRKKGIVISSSHEKYWKFVGLLNLFCYTYHDLPSNITSLSFFLSHTHTRIHCGIIFNAPSFIILT